jgi:hypothetical protein
MINEFSSFVCRLGIHSRHFRIVLSLKSGSEWQMGMNKYRLNSTDATIDVIPNWLKMKLILSVVIKLF